MIENSSLESPRGSSAELRQGANQLFRALVESLQRDDFPKSLEFFNRLGGPDSFNISGISSLDMNSDGSETIVRLSKRNHSLLQFRHSSGYSAFQDLPISVMPRVVRLIYGPNAKVEQNGKILESNNAVREDQERQAKLSSPETKRQTDFFRAEPCNIEELSLPKYAKDAGALLQSGQVSLQRLIDDKLNGFRFSSSAFEQKASKDYSTDTDYPKARLEVSYEGLLPPIVRLYLDTGPDNKMHLRTKVPPALLLTHLSRIDPLLTSMDNKTPDLTKLEELFEKIDIGTRNPQNGLFEFEEYQDKRTLDWETLYAEQSKAIDETSLCDPFYYDRDTLIVHPENFPIEFAAEAMRTLLPDSYRLNAEPLDYDAGDNTFQSIGITVGNVAFKLTPSDFLPLKPGSMVSNESVLILQITDLSTAENHQVEVPFGKHTREYLKLSISFAESGTSASQLKEALTYKIENNSIHR